MTPRQHHLDILVGTNLRRLRIKAGMTMTELAAEIGVSYQQIRKYEDGINRLSASMLWECARALNVPLSSLFARPPRRGNDNQNLSLE
jgi:transcriptional regulator with XRE-family HTH domain